MEIRLHYKMMIDLPYDKVHVVYPNLHANGSVGGLYS